MLLRLQLTLVLAACAGGAPRAAATPAPLSVSASDSPAPATISPHLEAELAVFRVAHGKPWEPGGEQEAAMRVAPNVFAQLPLVGASSNEVLAWLGPQTQPAASRVEGEETWTYIRSMGDVASIHVVSFRAGRVTAVRMARSR